jgi:hypothetical protein
MIHQAIRNTHPEVVTINGDDEAYDIHGNRVELNSVTLSAELARLKALDKSTEYLRKREKEYPPLTELADALYHQQNGDDTKMTAYLAKCEAVKQKYPKE